MDKYTSIDDFLSNNLDQNLAELSRFCAQPSVAAQNLGIKECADLTCSMLRGRGFEIELIPTPGAPVILAERKGRTDKTILFYNHYDVQPPEPLDLWDSPPFEPGLRQGKLFARGVSDDKGHITSRLFAIDALLNSDNELPCTIKFVIEGEEEISSVHLPDVIRQNKDKLAADVCVWEFGGVDHREIPIQYLGLRGICYVELSVETAQSDVHSGLGGSIFPNAAWRLIWALNTLKGSDERIRIPNHYEKVRPPTQRDLELMAKLPEISDEYKQRYGIRDFLGGTTGGLQLHVQEVFEPTCTICGITTGYQGSGAKTVLPARATAKVDFRLVPDQTPEDVLLNLRSHLDHEGYSDVSITYLGGEAPARTDPDHPFVNQVVENAREIYGSPMQKVPMIGGSGPNHVFIENLNVPIVTSGIGYPGSAVHAPNENIRVDLYLKGAKHITRIIQDFGESNI